MARKKAGEKDILCSQGSDGQHYRAERAACSKFAHAFYSIDIRAVFSNPADTVSLAPRMEDLTLSDLLFKYDSAEDSSSHSLSFVRTLLKELRKSKVIRSDIVLKWGAKCLPGESSIDVWNLHEQICVAAIDMGQQDLAVETIGLLKKQFPGSNRVKRLSGMLLESQERYQEALEVYNDILKNDIANLAAMKRKVCIHKAQHNTDAQVEELNGIVKFFPADTGCWAELGEIYLSLCDYQAAIHCFEELVLLDPRNAHYHCHLAEAYYSCGGKANVLVARKHYTISLNFQHPKFNVRALYGLISCCKMLKEANAKSTGRKNETMDHDGKVNAELLSYATQQLETLCSENSSNEALLLAKRAFE